MLLGWIGEIWNVFEAAIALWSAWMASSVALFAFGLDSLIEIFAGAVWISRESRMHFTAPKIIYIKEELSFCYNH